MNSKMLSNSLEKLRYGRGLTQDEFVSNIVSIRQYKRYRSGECDIPYQVLNLFSKKLQTPLTNLLYEFESELLLETKAMNELYNAIVNKDKDSITKYFSKIDEEFIIDPENKMYYQLCLLVNNFYNNKISKSNIKLKIFLLISYPDILKKQILTDIEILVLSSLLDFQSQEERVILVKKLTDIITKQVIVISGSSNKIHSLVLLRLSKYYGILQDSAQVIKLCNLGIEMGKSARSYYLFDYFYYYLSLAYYKIDNTSQFKLCIFQCFNTLYLEDNISKIKIFLQLIKDDYDISYKSFMKSYLECM
ncbi:MAG: hypothetical protein QM489_05885 [Candidatus Izemoplasma sp.]